MKRAIRRVLPFVMIFYLISVFWLFVFSRTPYRIDWPIGDYVRNFTNLIPLRTTAAMFLDYGAQSSGAIASTFLVIELAFFPFGVLYALWKPENTLRRCAVSAVLLALLVNLAKLLLYRGSFDVDDILLGTFSAIVGFLLERAIASRAGNEPCEKL